MFAHFVKKVLIQDHPFRLNWAVEQCHGFIHQDMFASCREALGEEVVTSYFTACVEDSCECDKGGDCECQCEQFEEYVSACEAKGMTYYSWRNLHNCRELFLTFALG